VRARPVDVDDAAVTTALADGWALRPASAAYLPVGGGGHHWCVADTAGATFFVTVDDLDGRDWLGGNRDDVLDGARRALTTAVALHGQAGLPFVVAPLVGNDGSVVARMGSRYAISMYPFLDGTSFAFGPYTDPSLRARVLGMLTALHTATPVVAAVAPDRAPRVGHREALDAFLHDPRRPWDAGPFSWPAWQSLAGHAAALSAVVGAFDRLVEATAPARQALVVTHGEPHPANVMAVDGELVLIDWDTVGLAPPERDLWLVIGAASQEACDYEAATGRRIDDGAMTLYRLRWYLDDIASAIHLFANRHDRTEDTERWWQGLAARLAELEAWRQRVP